ncbi:protein-glutamate O-methyltransferase CheR [Limibaculum sp. FT325]|uniref:CheR family methyltransferase n=1 Tax=Thermohalobaculum sediminis TaxID=2939436 RepID=UPI0020BF57E9|nr:protein-glutamate O-methyltransferase CheR [Limibaculum sediminis]MCL5776517.1 protein-glutamate O-methyltransferase CheR [Limibaculum sediminis]
MPAQSGSGISRSDVLRLAAIALRESGLRIDESKADFLLARLGSRIAELGLSSFSDYAAHLESAGGGGEMSRFIESITTHTTEFFRERAQYDWLAAQGIPSLWSAGVGRSRDLVVWSAACSTGQELYSAAMILEDLALRAMRGLRWRGIGTDISRAVLEPAALAVYRIDEIGAIPSGFRVQSLLHGRRDPRLVRFRPEIRRRTEWRRANLCVAGDLEGIRCDVIFLRNVLIYSDAEMRRRILRNVVACLQPAGYLLTGHSEPIEAASYGLVSLRPSVYRKAGG